MLLPMRNEIDIRQKERELIGYALHSPAWWPRLSMKQPDDFVDPNHRKLWRAIQHGYQTGADPYDGALRYLYDQYGMGYVRLLDLLDDIGLAFHAEDRFVEPFGATPALPLYVNEMSRLAIKLVNACQMGRPADELIELATAILCAAEDCHD